MNGIFGLGNPGIEYRTTRHNAGFMVAEFLVQEWQLGEMTAHKKTNTLVAKSADTVVALPQTYMNRSGEAVQACARFFEIDTKNVIVIFDDLDIELGSYKIQWAKGPKVHNGLSSVYQHLKTDQFWHVRVGVDSRQGDRSIPGERYVLQPFSTTELDTLNALMPQLARDLQASLTK